ncbi:unnamed protein product, partial [Brachionus calyciflorus]
MNKTVSIDDRLDEKLTLYLNWSKRMIFKKNENSNLYKILSAQETRDEVLVKNKSELAKQINKMNNELKGLKDSMAQIIMTASNHYSFLARLAKLDTELADDINRIIIKNKELNKKFNSTLFKKIVELFGLDLKTVGIEEKKGGKQSGFIINHQQTGLKLFVKTSKIFEFDINSIDPRELFVYKVLEYMKLGPDTRFLIYAASSSSSTGDRICRIITKDLEYKDNENITKKFFTDNFITEEDENFEALEHRQKSLNNREFRVSFLTLSMVNDLLHLNDTLATNAWNYGSISQESKKFAPQYKANLVDHQVKNTLFKFKPEMNPVISLIEKLKINSGRQSINGQLISYKIIKDNKIFVDPVQLKSELLEAISSVRAQFSEAVKDAEEDIKGIMSNEKFEEYFSVIAH